MGFSCRRRLRGGGDSVRDAPPTRRQATTFCYLFWDLPDDLDQLAHVHVIWNQELGLVQNWQLLLSLISLNDDLHLADRK